MPKRIFRPNIKQRCLLIFLLVSFIWSMYQIIATQSTVKNLKGELNRIHGAISNIQKQQEAVQIEIAKWNDPNVIEEFARKELGLVKPGEITYMFSEAVQPVLDTEVTKRNSSSKEGIGN